MINSQSTDRYIQLEQELLQSLPTRDLERLEKEAQRLAEIEHALQQDQTNGIVVRAISISITVFVFGMITIVPVLYFANVSQGLTILDATERGFFMTFTLLKVAWFCIAFYFGYITHYGEICYEKNLSFGFCFSAGNSDFAVHRWDEREDDFDRFRYWKEVLGGMHGPVTASLIPLTTEEQKFILKVKPQGFPRPIGPLILGILGTYFTPFVAIMQIFTAWSNERAKAKEIIYPDRFIYTGQSYHLLLKILDSRVPGPSRRL